jgi:hypothetical protein
MEQSYEVRSRHHLLQVSGHLYTRMSELLELREAVRSAERCGREPVHPAVVDPPLGKEPEYRS